MRILAVLTAAALGLTACAPEVTVSTGEAKTTSRNVAWDGGEKIDLDLSIAQVTFSTGPVAAVTVEGAEPLVKRFAIDKDGFRLRHASLSDLVRIRLGTTSGTDRKITVDGESFTYPRDLPLLKVTITSPNSHRFEVNGGTRLTLTDYNQAFLGLAVNGGAAAVGSVETREANFDVNGGGRLNLTGHADSLNLDVNGGGQANLDQFVVEVLNVDANGGASVTASPLKRATIDANGGARIRLTTDPETLDIDSNGGASISTPGRAGGDVAGPSA